MDDLIFYKGKQVIVVYNENPDAEALTLKGFCVDASQDFICVKSSGNIFTSIKRDWIRKIKTKNKGGKDE